VADWHTVNRVAIIGSGFEGLVKAHLGNAFSIQPRLTQNAYFRPHNRSEDVRRLYLVGAGTHPGGGVPGVVPGAEATEQCVVEDPGPSGGAPSRAIADRLAIPVSS